MGRDRERERTGVLVVMAGLGILAGAVAAVFTAPASGKETRRALASRARAGRDLAVRAAQRGRELAARRRETLSAAVERGFDAYERARHPEEGL